MYSARVLRPEEWHRLEGTEAETIWPALDPRTAQVLVVEQGDGAIKGCWILAPVYHVECLWIAPECRKTGSVARRLWQAMRSTAARLGLPTVTTAACSEDIAALLAHVGAVQIPGVQYVIPMEGR
jgi:N-acetylglutamate synthase-like GNAT family acetyltransferase